MDEKKRAQLAELKLEILTVEFRLARIRPFPVAKFPYIILKIC